MKPKIDRAKHRYFLICHNGNEAYSLIDREKYQGTWEHDMPNVSYGVCVESAETLPGLVGKEWASGDPNVYVTLDWVNSKGQTKHKKYPYHYNDIHVLIGYVEEVCDIGPDDVNHYEKEKWRVGFTSDIWIMTDDWTLKRVFGFESMMHDAVDAYIKANNLEYDEGAANPWKEDEDAAE